MGTTENNDNPKIQAALERVETSLKELQVVVVDVAVVKSQMSAVKEDISSIFKSLFNGPPGGSLVDRVTKTEGIVNAFQGIRIEERLVALEKDKVNSASCQKVHEDMSSKMWKILIPIITAFILVAASVLFNDLYVTKNRSEKELESQTKILRQLIQEELRGVSPSPVKQVNP